MSSSRSHTIYISVGSNIDRDKHTRAGLHAMYQAFGELQLSSVFESESVGFEGDNFYNLVVKAHTDLSIEQICKILKQIEHDNKRERLVEKFAPRTLDLDLLIYDQVVTQLPIELPRGEILYNAFVLWPMAEIASDELHPVVNQTYGKLWQCYDKSQQSIWKIPFTWSPDLK